MEKKPEVKPAAKSPVAVAKELTRDIYIRSVVRVVELSEKMNPPPDPATIKRMIQRRFDVAVTAAEVFTQTWPSQKGRFIAKED